MKRQRILVCFFSLFMVTLHGQEPIFTIIESELNRNFSILKEEPIPAYYISIRVDEVDAVAASGHLGKLQGSTKIPSKNRTLTTVLRVGDHNLDNSHEVSGGYSDGLSASYAAIPVDDNAHAIKMIIWGRLDNLFKNGIQSYEQIKTNISIKTEKEDKSPDFTKETVETYYEAPISFADLKIDMNAWEDKVRKYSAVFETNKDIVSGAAIFYTSLTREYFIDTEGRKIVQNRVACHLILESSALADDGMVLPLYKTWFAYSPEQLPSDKEVLDAAEQMSQHLSALVKAPLADAFTGPAILSPEAAGVFFHEIFGHRIEASRMKKEHDAQTFKKKINEKVLPNYMSVTFDPTLKTFGKNSLNGYYLYDNEGIKSQRVEVVKNGVLKNFLMCRTPITGFPKSNGHGRAEAGEVPVSRQSNMFVESSKTYSDEELRKMLLNEAKKQKKQYAYYIKEVSGGYTTTSTHSPNAFDINPLLVYRVYVDGRPDELVRGVSLIGTPLTMFAQIEACGNSLAVFNGSCGAESGSVPVSCIAPSLFVKRIETQKEPVSNSQPFILSRPQ